MSMVAVRTSRAQEKAQRNLILRTSRVLKVAAEGDGRKFKGLAWLFMGVPWSMSIPRSVFEVMLSRVLATLTFGEAGSLKRFQAALPIQVNLSHPSACAGSSVARHSLAYLFLGRRLCRKDSSWQIHIPQNVLLNIKPPYIAHYNSFHFLFHYPYISCATLHYPILSSQC